MWEASSETPESTVATGAISAIRGGVVDVSFQGRVPAIHTLLRAGDVPMEVAGVVDDATVRCVALGGVEGLTFSEAQFMALPPDQRAQLSTEVIDYIASVRTFFRALIAAGDEAFERGDDIASERYWQAALTLGKTLDQDGRMAILRQVGTALKRMANESLAKRPVLPAEPWAPAEAQPSSAQPVPRPSARESN